MACLPQSPVAVFYFTLLVKACVLTAAHKALRDLSLTGYPPTCSPLIQFSSLTVVFFLFLEYAVTHSCLGACFFAS